MENSSIKMITFFVLTCLFILTVHFITSEINDMKIIEQSGFVTDKWIENSMFLSFSNTDYILEINNEYTKEVTHFEYRNIEIGDIFYYKEYDYRDIK